MKKLAVGILSAMILTGVFSACGANVEVDPMVTDSPNGTNAPNSTNAPNATNAPNGQSNGLAQTDGMQ